ncbi:MAG: hypothetical protein JOZ41_00515 [Chloroflexi bacterium]|nr:hypothetical protein [Chloroflexota bacterium]
MAESVGQDRGPVPGDVNAWFFKETALDELLAGAQPLRSIEDLAIEDLTREEAESFLHAIKE